MSEPRELDIIPMKRAARCLVGKTRASLHFRRQEHVDSDFLSDPVSRKITTGLVAQIGSQTLKAGSTLQTLTAQSVGEAEFYAVVREEPRWTVLEVHVHGSGDSNKGWNAERRLYRLGAGSTSIRDTSGVQERAQDGDLTVKQVPTAKKCADVGTKPVSASVPPQRFRFAGLVFY